MDLMLSCSCAVDRVGKTYSLKDVVVNFCRCAIGARERAVEVEHKTILYVRLHDSLTLPSQIFFLP